MKRSTTIAAFLLALISMARAADPVPMPGEMAGYLLVPHEKAPETFNAGFSMYVAAWPLLKEYPGNRFQTGLFGTWMHPQFEGPEPTKHYTDIEGGLGWWRDTRFATETPKFIMGGVALNFSEWANGPGAGKNRDWNNPKGLYGVAQLSPWVLWPPDGLNLKQGTSGELFGYGYLPLPLANAKKTTTGKPVPTGNQCWTLFLNSGNFKGPVAFFTPYFWTKASVADETLAGTFLDTRPSKPNRAVQMETQHIPARIAKDSKGELYARVAPTAFPRNAKTDTAAVHRMMVYSKAALWDGVQAWFDGGKAVSGKIDMETTFTQKFKGGGGSTWRIYADGSAKEQRVPLDWSSFATPAAIDEETYGYQWKADLVGNEDTLTRLPEFYKLGKNKFGKDHWVVVSAKDVPEETGLAKVTFPRPKKPKEQPYETSEDANGSWKKPGPVAGPFTVTIGDGSVVTYSWYRFADQPALLNADLTAEEREAMQKRVEKLHSEWTKEKEYLPGPKIGKLADIDPTLVVTPPKGFEIGYVPIVTKQGAK